MNLLFMQPFDPEIGRMCCVDSVPAILKKCKNAGVRLCREKIILPAPTAMRICTENDLGQSRLYIVNSQVIFYLFCSSD